MPNITISRPFEFDHLETLHIRIPHKVMTHLVSETGWWKETDRYPPRLDLRIEEHDIDPPLFSITLIDTEHPQSGHWCIPERVENNTGKIKAWDYHFRSHKFPHIPMIPNFSGIMQSEVHQGEHPGEIWVTVQPFVAPVEIPVGAREGKIRKKFKGSKGWVLEDGFSRTIVWHRFESPDVKEPVDFRLHHKSDASWTLQIGETKLDNVDVSLIGKLFRLLGYKRTMYQTEKCNLDPNPDLHPFGVE